MFQNLTADHRVKFAVWKIRFFAYIPHYIRLQRSIKIKIYDPKMVYTIQNGSYNTVTFSNYKYPPPRFCVTAIISHN